jgi:8-oxo-dGTP pyrophosphatase MutT (NUDIX family)
LSVIDDATLTTIRARLAAELAPPAARFHPLLVAGTVAGWVDDVRYARLAALSDVFESRDGGLCFVRRLGDEAARTRALEHVARTLASEGLLTAWRNERYEAGPALGQLPWFLIERAAARYLGILTYAAHVNGLVRRQYHIEMWIARRSPTKAIDPGKLDNLIGGGIAAGLSVASTVIKEAFEEAGIDAPLAARAIAVGTVDVCRQQPDGFQRETIFVHDLWLPEDFVPACRDGEAVEHRLLRIDQTAALIANGAGPDVVTADASLVILDCLLRHGTIARDSPHRGELEALMHPACC